MDYCFRHKGISLNRIFNVGLLSLVCRFRDNNNSIIFFPDVNNMSVEKCPNGRTIENLAMLKIFAVSLKIDCKEKIS